MTSLGRILKYMATFVTALFVLAWVSTTNSVVGLATKPVMGSSRTVYFASGSLHYARYIGVQDAPPIARDTYFWHAQDTPVAWAKFAGTLDGEFDGPWFWFSLPIPFVIAVLFPLAVGPFVTFRFRLWHYLAYTALIALELAYYLRWQA